MKCLYPEIPWNTIKAVGFDMDGTLYDEFDFIYQVYSPISKLFSNEKNEANTILNIMLQKWLEKGSSYPFIFSETLKETGWNDKTHKPKIDEALTLFRNFQPVLNLQLRIKYILRTFKNLYELFLVSDGSSTLQWNKIRALELEDYFTKQNIFVSGDYGKEAEKPGLMSLDCLVVFTKGYKNDEIVFVGDRAIDREYAKNAGFHYIDIADIIRSKNFPLLMNTKL